MRGLFDDLPRFLIEKVHVVHVDGKLDGLMNGGLGVGIYLCRKLILSNRDNQNDFGTHGFHHIYHGLQFIPSRKIRGEGTVVDMLRPDPENDFIVDSGSIIKRAIILVRKRGKRILYRNFIGPVPSMLAASERSVGTLRKNCLNRRVPVALAKKGIVRAQ